MKRGKNNLEFAATANPERCDETAPVLGLLKRAACAGQSNSPSTGQFLFPKDRAKLVGARRLAVLQRFAGLRPQWGSTRAAELVGASLATLWRWQRAFDEKGAAGLRPMNFKSGRRSRVSGVRLNGKAIRELEKFHV